MGVSQISIALIQLDKVIQQNATASESLAEMSGELSDQATRLSESIGFFKIRTPENHTQAARSPSASKEKKKEGKNRNIRESKSFTTAIALKENETADEAFEEF
jgi:methyl-accepting chemotaxis protein